MSEASARRHDVGVLILAATLVLAVAVLGTWLLFGGQDDRQGSTWNEYRADGDELVVYAMVRRCDEVVGAEAEETSGRVEVTLRIDPGGVCADVAVEAAATVRLDEPLGVRRVYDGACLAQDGDERQCLRRVRE